MAKPLIYVIDDEPAITRIVQVTLERAGYAIKTAQDGAQGWEMLAGETSVPDLILLDATMPYMDGFELLARIRADGKLKDVPVAMVTARAQDADILEAQERGVDGYITKPIVVAELMNVVRILLEPCAETETDG